jgi:tetratricopeptide (TPR) repeat protein
VRFTQYIPIRDTAAWDLGDNADQEIVTIPKSAFLDLQRAAVFVGERTARSFMDQWETQDRVIFVYDKFKWNVAYDYALAFEWDKAMEIWLELVKSNNAKEAACASFNVALACEMQGNFELAKKWLNLSQKTLDMPETRYYKELLLERKK